MDAVLQVGMLRHARSMSWSVTISENAMHYWEACSHGDQWKPQLDNSSTAFPAKQMMIKAYEGFAERFRGMMTTFVGDGNTSSGLGA